MVYLETHRRVRLLDGSDRKVEALCFMVDRTHPQYAGRLSVAEQAELVRAGKGESGHNLEYVANTLRHLDEMGLQEPSLNELLEMLEQETANASHTRVATT